MLMLMFTISIAQISIWIWSNALYKFQRAQLNEVGLKEPCCQLGAQPLNTIHIWPQSSTAPQPEGLDWESILRREETGVPGENPRSQVEIDWNSIHIQHCSRGERRDWCPLHQPGWLTCWLHSPWVFLLLLQLHLLSHYQQDPPNSTC